MSTRKYRFDPETGLLAPISVSHVEPHAPGPPLLVRALRLALIVTALAVSATVFSMANGESVVASGSDARP